MYFKKLTKVEEREIKGIVQEKVMEESIFSIIDGYKKDFDEVLRLERLERMCEKWNWDWNKISSTTLLTDLFVDKYHKEINWPIFLRDNLFKIKYLKYIKDLGMNYVMFDLIHEFKNNHNTKTAKFIESNFCEYYDLDTGVMVYNTVTPTGDLILFNRIYHY